MKNINITNPIYFWTIIILVCFSLSLGYSFLTKENKIPIIPTTGVENIQKHSFNNTQNTTINKNEFPNLNVKLQPEWQIVDFLTTKSNLLLVCLIIYSIFLSLLFTYRERGRISKEMLNEKIRIERERVESKVNMYDNIESELLKYNYLLMPDFKIDNLDTKIMQETNYVLFSARVVLEKILLQIGKKYSIENEKLSDLIYALYSKRILDAPMNGYAHTIKAFGNRVAHPSLDFPIKFTSKDALLVLSVLVTFLNALEAKNLLEDFKNVA